MASRNGMMKKLKSELGGGAVELGCEGNVSVNSKPDHPTPPPPAGFYLGFFVWGEVDP